MKRGAFAFIDALGFKGIWKRLDGDQVIRKLKNMAADTASHVEFGNSVPGPVGAPGMFGPLHLAFLSDSIAMAAELGSDPVATGPTHGLTVEGTAITWLVLHVSKLLRAAALSDPPLAYRGCISFGEFMVEDRFIIGQAVDQAAELERLAEGAFVWLDPIAKSIVESTQGRDPPECQNLHIAPVPLKHGQLFDTYVVLPYGAGESPETRSRINDRLLSFFDVSRLDVALKEQNTRRLLCSGAAACKVAFENMDRIDRNIARWTSE